MEFNASRSLDNRRIINENGEIELGNLWAVIWAGKRLIASCMAAMLLIAIVYLHLATPRYTASLVVTPVVQGSSGSKMAGLGALANLAGINMSGTPDGMNFLLYSEGIKSRAAAEVLAQDPKFMRTVFAGEWNSGSEEWEESNSLSKTFIVAVKAVLGITPTPWIAPNAARLQDYLISNVVIVNDTKQGLVTLSISHSDPEFGKMLLDRVHETVDEHLRQRTLHRVNGNIAYLTDKLNRITISDYREALVRTLSEQESQKMSASSASAFAAEPFGSTVASTYPTSPRGVLVIVISLVLGLLVGVALAILHHIRKPQVVSQWTDDVTVGDVKS